MGLTVRRATADDAAGIARVHAAGVATGIATLDVAASTAADVRARLAAARPTHPTVVAVVGDDVLAAAWLVPYSPRAAYDGVAEFSVYVDPASVRMGLGTLVVGALLQSAERAGLHKVVGKVLAENRASRALCARLGFREVGVHLRHGQVGGAWVDVVVVERLLGPATGVRTDVGTDVGTDVAPHITTGG
ncbi:MAG: GNAT family N-acetyltransferase [Motilibacteraceae bacterium]